MHPIVYSKFRELLGELKPAGRVLEVGAQAGKTALLAMPELSALDRIGINLVPAARFEGFDVLQGNANDMRMFGDASFDLILSNAMLEHDERFWLTCSEIRRLVRPGGTAVLGVPGFSVSCDVAALDIPRPAGRAAPGWADCSLTFKYHAHPDDYYRFSEQAMRKVLLEGFEVMRIVTIMVPPRIIGIGIKPA